VIERVEAGLLDHFRNLHSASKCAGVAIAADTIRAVLNNLNFVIHVLPANPPQTICAASEDMSDKWVPAFPTLGNVEGILITRRRSGFYFVFFPWCFSVGVVLAKARAHLRGCSSLHFV
jgi:hypothetical protein